MLKKTDAKHKKMKARIIVVIITIFIYKISFTQFSWEEVLLPDFVEVKMVAFYTTGKHFIATNKYVYEGWDLILENPVVGLANLKQWLFNHNDEDYGGLASFMTNMRACETIIIHT